MFLRLLDRCIPKAFLLIGAFGLVFSVATLSAAPPTYQHDVLPLFEKKCVACHGEGKQAMGGLDLRSLETVLTGGASGPAVNPGQPEESLLWKQIADGKMPMGGQPLGEDEKALVRAWIEKGQFPTKEEALAAKRRGKITEEARQWWAFQKPVKPAVPAVQDQKRVRTPIDAFVLKRLEDKGWSFSPDADRRTLIRRVYLDLIGIPPTPTEVDAFLGDSSSDAYEKLVDRLLASPHYGERWGRHWLDIAGYSESVGNAPDEIRPLAWEYRDYVIRSINADKPYNQFLLEQFAGDQIVNYDPQGRPRPEDREKLIATGFLRVPPDLSDQQTIYQVDKWYDALQSTVETSLKGVMGLTFGCARCHDHKFDPILHEDYYKLTAIYQAALDPEKWVGASLFYGQWPTRYILDADSQQREAYIQAALNEYPKMRKEREAISKEYTRLRKELREEISKDAAAIAGSGNKPDDPDDPDNPDNDSYGAISDAEIDKRHPELAKRSAAYHEWETKYNGLKPRHIWALWDVSKKPSQTHILLRGNYLAPGDPVEPGIPAVLDDPENPFRFPEPKEEWNHTGRRLTFAKWLTQPDHPLTSRVIVNRIWQFHFGEGIVRTPDDFGTQGLPPTHPELLDWLATNFVENGWSFKRMHRQIVLSTTYRQASTEDPAKVAQDPSNKLLWRKTPIRLEAEAIRDSLLSVTGEINLKLYGESVPLRKGDDGQYFTAGKGEEGFRRSLYVLNRRTTPYSFLLAFDAPTMDNGSMSQRFRSSLPGQALAMMNNPFVIERARSLAKRVQTEVLTIEEQLRLVYRLVYSRPPETEELRLLHNELENAPSRDQAWQVICQALLGSNEFLYSF